MARTTGSIVKKPYLESARSYAWARMRDTGDFTVKELVEHLSRRGKDVEGSNLRIYVKALLDAGILAVVANGRNGRPGRYRLVRNLGPLPPVEREDGSGVTDPNTLKEPWVRTEPLRGARRATYWKAIRVFGQRRAAFTVRDLVVLVADEKGKASVSDVRWYLAALVKSGHLTSQTICRVHEFRVARDTGPKYPIVRADGSVYDPNDRTDTRVEVMA